MATTLIAFLAIAVVAPTLTRWLSTKVFLVIALVPIGALGWVVAQSSTVLAGGVVAEKIPWIPALGIELSFRLDALAWLMALIVTGIGALVLIYCANYFTPDEPGLGRFAALLVGFAGTMFGLVTADDIVVMFMFWEITSVLSYLLIGHYFERKESRGAALQALLVTTFGGLIMLVGVVMIAAAAETTSLAAIVEQGLTGPMPTIAILLILVGAVSKSALVPFHFWLPAAMAAPTPVSAYLHAAAMVKAGVYLVARLAPGYADIPGWHETLIGLGVFTMLVGGWRSLRQYDLKLVLAYGTVSQLGFLLVITSIGTPDATLAACALLLAHALYKATLFLIIGIVDRRTGTRDWRKLSGLGRAAPVLATLAVIAAASMAGFPPLFGFLAKEAVFTALLENALAGGDFWAWLAIVGAVLGSVLTVAYSIRFVWGAFARRRTSEPVEIKPVRPTILAAPAVLVATSLFFGLFGWVTDALLRPIARTVGEPHNHLALWHGFTPALALSAGVLLLGAVMFWKRIPIARFQRRVPPIIEASRGYWASAQAVDRLSARITIFAQRGGLVQYLSTILVVFVLTLGTIAALGRVWPTEIRLWDYPAQLGIGLLMATAALFAARAKQRMTAVLLVGVTGFGLVALFAMHGAPDLALTQALVETITVVVFVLVLRRLPDKIAQHNKPVRRVQRAVIGALTGTVMAVVALVALGSRQAGSIATELPRMAVEEAHGRNIVNVMLVDIRAWDTMGEISVLVVVATGIASLIFVTQRGSDPARLGAGRARRRGGARTLLIPDPQLGSVRTGKGRQAWLLGGRRIAELNRSLLLEVLVRLMFHPAIIVSIFLLFVGHNEPGGGFAGGLLAGLALVFRYLAGGRYELREAVSIDAGKVLGLGLLLAVGTATAALVFGGAALESAYFSAEVPVLGHLSFGTSTLFDIGVYLVVVGLALDILRSLGAEVDRQQAEATLENFSTDEFSPDGVSR